MNDPRFFSIDPCAPLVRSTGLSLRIIAIWMFLICLPGFCIVGNSISDPSNSAPWLIVFCYGFLLPFGMGITLLICANQIERGRRNAVIVAMWIAFAWLLLVLVLIVLLAVDAFVTLTTPSPDDELAPACSIAMIATLLPIEIYCWILIQKLRTISKQSTQGFLVLPKITDESESNVAKPINDWPEIESDND